MTEKNNHLNRRDFLKLGGLASLFALAGGAIYYLSNLTEQVEAEDAVSANPDKENSPYLEGVIDPEKFRRNFEGAVRQSLENDGTEVVLEMPHGEFTFPEKIDLAVPEGAFVRLKANSKGTVLKLANALAGHPNPDFPPEGMTEKEWHDQIWPERSRGLMEFTVAGKLVVDGFEVDLGSKKANQGRDYRAPIAPWNSGIIIAGDCDSGKGFSVLGEVRKGRAAVINCSFADSESSGVVLQGLEEAIMMHCRGQRLDALGVANWCREVRFEDLEVEKCLSDGYFLVRCDRGELTKLRTKTARQGVDLWSCTNMKLTDIEVTDCNEGLTINSFCETGRLAENIEVTDFTATGCNMAFAIGNAVNINLRRFTAVDNGKWLTVNDFYHQGVVGYADLLANKAQAYWLGDPLTTEVNFNQSRIEIDSEIPDNYRIPQPPDGLTIEQEGTGIVTGLILKGLRYLPKDSGIGLALAAGFENSDFRSRFAPIPDTRNNYFPARFGFAEKVQNAMLI